MVFNDLHFRLNFIHLINYIPQLLKLHPAGNSFNVGPNLYEIFIDGFDFSLDLHFNVVENIQHLILD